MESRVFERIRGGLLERREHLAEWLQATPSHKRRVRLGPVDERAVQAHLDVLDMALEKAADKTLGLCRVCHDYVDTELLEMDYTACVCIDHYSTEEKRRLERELELSQVVQRALLPHRLPTIPGLDLAVFSRPAQIICGDYFDFVRFGDGTHGLAIADVAGHGVAASLLAASVQTALRTLIPASDGPADVVRQVNRFFCHNIHFTTFVTLFLARFDHRTRTLAYCNAGHNPPLLFRMEDGGRDRAVWLRPTGPAVGLVEEFQIAAEEIALAPGDILLLYTDGVTEVVNPQIEEFGTDRLAALVRRESHASAKELMRALRDALEEFADGQPLADDVTIIACKVEA